MDAKLYAAADGIMRDRDRARRWSTEHPELPTLCARYQGEVVGYDLALASLAGAFDYHRRETLEAAVRLERQALAIARGKVARMTYSPVAPRTAADPCFCLGPTRDADGESSSDDVLAREHPVGSPGCERAAGPDDDDDDDEDELDELARDAVIAADAEARIEREANEREARA